MNKAKFPDYFCQVKYQTITLDNIRQIVPLLENKIDPLLVEAFDTPLLPDMSNLTELIYESFQAEVAGTKHLLWESYLKKYGSDGIASNILLPIIVSWQDPPFISAKIMISNPTDSKLVAKTNLQKMGNFKHIIVDSILSTTNQDQWRRQREHLNIAFLPNSSLAKIFGKSKQLADDASTKLMTLFNLKCKDQFVTSLKRQYKIYKPNLPNNQITLNINEFLLRETQTQLQLSLLGMTSEFNEMTNAKIREAFNGTAQDGYVTQFAEQLIETIHNNQYDMPTTDKTINNLKGPLSALLKTSLPTSDTELYANAVLIAFAGHDTTGHTLSWLIYELCRNPIYQQRLKTEIETFLINHPKDQFTYQDLDKLPFLTRCLMETLRLWPAVPNGTFREITTTTSIAAKNNRYHNLPIDTNVQLITWTKHRSKELWGEDAEIFNPDREFRDNEIWNNQVFSATNPASERFQPFSYSPRDCLGKNFAQMEMRLILIYLLKDFTFTLTQTQTLHSTEEYQGINRATLGPKNVMATTPLSNKLLLDNPSMALWVDIKCDKYDNNLIKPLEILNFTKNVKFSDYFISKL